MKLYALYALRIMLPLAALVFLCMAFLKPNMLHKAYIIVGLLLALPVMTYMDYLQPVLPSKLLHHIETFVRCVTVSIFVWLFVTFNIESYGLLITFSLFYFSCFFTLSGSRVVGFIYFKHYFNKMHVVYFATLISAVLLALHPTLSPLTAWLIATVNVGLIIVMRHSLWFMHLSDHYPLRPAQHCDVWPLLIQKTTPEQLYLHVYCYALRHGEKEYSDSLDYFTFSLLLGFFKSDLQITNNLPLSACTKSKINERDARAVYIWELYPNVLEAIKHIENLGARDSIPLQGLALPSMDFNALG